jgi:hypothetical protein
MRSVVFMLAQLSWILKIHEISCLYVSSTKVSLILKIHEISCFSVYSTIQDLQDPCDPLSLC